MSLLAVRQGMIGGLATYVRELAGALARHEGKSYLFFVPEDLASYWGETLPPSARIVPLKVPNGSATRRALFEVFALPGLARDMQCQVLFYPNVTAPLVSGERGPVPVVTVFDVMYRSQVHDTPRHKRLFLDACYSTIGFRGTRVVTISHFSKQDITKHTRIRPDQITPIYCGVDEAFFCGETSASSPERPYVLSVSATYPHKRLPMVVEAFETVATRHPDLELWMVGTNHGSAGERQLLLDGIEASSVRNRIRRLASVSWEEMPSIYSGATALLHGSAYEGFGLPVAEAMASGIPVAAAPAPAVVELLDGSGRIADGWLKDDLARALDSVLGWSPEERGTRTARGRAIAEARFRWPRIAEALHQEFMKVEL